MIGDRIRQVRLAAGLTQDEVVARLASAGLTITKAALSKYEKGKSRPKQSVLVLLGRVLGVKPNYFVAEPLRRIEWRAYRKQTSLGKGKQEQIKAFVETLVEKQSWLERIFYPNERCAFPKPTAVAAAQDAEVIARELRKAWGLDKAPIDSLVWIIEDKGGFVVEYPKPEIQFDGLSGRVDGRPVVVVNAETSVDRFRYNVARELGRLMVFCSSFTPKEEEGLADRFAAALLVPADVATRELGEKRRHLSFAELGILKQKYGLSMQAWIRRARDLMIISEGLYKTLCIEFSAKGWRRQEPSDYCGQEKPKRLVQMALRAVAEGIVTREDANRIFENCGVEPMAAGEMATGDAFSPIELLRLPRAQRAGILAGAAARAEKEYRNRPDLTDFNAFGEDDLYAEGESSETR